MGPNPRGRGTKMKTIKEFLSEAGLTDAEIASTNCDEPSRWDRELVAASISDYENPETAARRAKRTGPGIVRAAKIHAARVAWLAAQ